MTRYKLSLKPAAVAKDIERQVASYCNKVVLPRVRELLATTQKRMHRHEVYILDGMGVTCVCVKGGRTDYRDSDGCVSESMQDHAESGAKDEYTRAFPELCEAMRILHDLDNHLERLRPSLGEIRPYKFLRKK